MKRYYWDTGYTNHFEFKLVDGCTLKNSSEGSTATMNNNDTVKTTNLDISCNT
jgi:hypothetical protein